MNTVNSVYGRNTTNGIRSVWNLLLDDVRVDVGNTLKRNQVAPSASVQKTRTPPLKSTTATPTPLQNRFLALLPREDFARIASKLELVSLPMNFALYEAGGRSMDVYFPTTAIVSLVSALEDGSTIETALVGNEGVLGISLFMGNGTKANRPIVQSAGLGYRMKAHCFDAEFERGGALQRALFLYTQTLMAQMTQNAVCNRRHSIEQQVARRLLLSLDRAETNTLEMTHDLLAGMLGVRREGITAAAGSLQRAGVIRYSRGRVDIIDRNGLEKFACECYSVVRSESRRLFAENEVGSRFFQPDV